MNLLSNTIYGSTLYGTSIPTSDRDYRAVYLPDIDDCLLGRVRHSWEDKSKDDVTYFSLQHFLRLASEGQSIAIELLAAPDDKMVDTSPTWQYLRENRRRFYTKHLDSFLGYSKAMASRYGRRINRLQEAESILSHMRCGAERLNLDTSYAKLAAVWDELPTSINAEKIVNDRNSGADKRAYVVCGREIQATVTIDHAISVVENLCNSYGERVRKITEGVIEFKAVAHAFRAAMQVKEIALTGDLHFPLKDAEWLRELRLGKIDFFKEHLDKRLDDLIGETQELIDHSSLPDKVDPSFVDSIILNAYNR